MSARTLGMRIVWLGVAVIVVAAGLIVGWVQVAQGSNVESSVSVSSVTATPAKIAPIDVLTIGTTFHNTAARLDNVTVELEVYDETGNVVLRERQSGVGISQDTNQAVYWVWRIPQRLQDGPYVVGITIYETESGSLLDREDSGATFTVARSTR
jgi:hypothetical protein